MFLRKENGFYVTTNTGDAHKRSTEVPRAVKMCKTFCLAFPLHARSTAPPLTYQLCLQQKKKSKLLQPLVLQKIGHLQVLNPLYVYCLCLCVEITISKQHQVKWDNSNMHTYIFCDYFSYTHSVWQGALERIPAVSGKTQRQRQTLSSWRLSPTLTCKIKTTDLWIIFVPSTEFLILLGCHGDDLRRPFTLTLVNSVFSKLFQFIYVWWRCSSGFFHWQSPATIQPVFKINKLAF